MRHSMSIRFIPVVAFAIALFAAGCVTVSDTVYLDRLSVSGPIAQPPVHLMNKPQAGDVRISPSLSIRENKTFDSHVTANVYSDDMAQTQGDNFHWSLPAAQFGLDMDVMASSVFALDIGVRYASSERSDDLGGNLGFGLAFGGQSMSGRIDMGVQWQRLWYDAHSVVVHQTTWFFSSETQTSVYYYHDINTSTPASPYISLTLNGTGGNIVNGFGSIAISHQTITNFQPLHYDVNMVLVDYQYTDARASQAVTFLTLTPGLSFTLSPSMQLMTGLYINVAVDGFGGDQPVFLSPMIQVDVKL